MTNDALTAAGRWVARRLPVRQTIWLKRLRSEELAWQRKQRQIRALDSSAESTTFRHRASLYTLVSRGYDSEQAVLLNCSRVREALRSARIDCVLLPSLTPFKPILVVPLKDVRATLQALESRRETEGWSIRVHRAKGKSLTLQSAMKRPDEVFRIFVSRHVVGPSGYLMSTPSERVVIEPWQEAEADEPRADGSTHLPATLRRRSRRRGTLVEYLTPQTWKEMVQSQGQDQRESRGQIGARDRDILHLYELTEPIDLVYTWVDGNDPAWQARKHKAEGLIDDAAVNETALSASRFQNRDELKYSLRSVEAYANWVNHIYIVTDGQVPEWLNSDHPKITVIDHREIFTDSSVLPVFNSHAIESQLHHIQGLSERYLYMNDDLFFMRPVRPEKFFTSSGLSKFFASRAPLDVDEPSARDLPVLSAAKNGRAFMRKHHGRTVTNKFKHTPHPQLRGVLQQMETDHPDLFRTVSASKFRDPADVSIASSLYHFHAYALGRAVPGSIAYDYLDISSERAPLRLEWFSYQRKLDVVCLNDTHTDDSEVTPITQMLTEFLEHRFSIASSFERV